MASTKLTIAAMRLPCGCVISGKESRFCDEARRLSKLAEQAEWDARGAETHTKWLAYEAARKTYNNHFLRP